MGLSILYYLTPLTIFAVRAALPSLKDRVHTCRRGAVRYEAPGDAVVVTGALLAF